MPKVLLNQKVAKIRRIQEYVGIIYFSYLANLPDLALFLMDEALHRYYASAGARAPERSGIQCWGLN